MDLGTLDYTGLAALLTAGGHIAYTLYRGWKAKQLALIAEESETITAQGQYLQSIATSAASIVETSEQRVSCLSEQLGVVQTEYAVLRKLLMETQDIVGALKADNRRQQERIIRLEQENRELKARIKTLEKNGNS